MDRDSPWVHALSGAVASVLAMLLMYPLEMIRAQLHVAGRGVSATACIRSLIHRDGITGLYAGLQINLVGVFISTLTYFFLHSYLSSMFSLEGKVVLDTVQRLVLAAIAGVLNVCLTIPLWVVSTRLMVEDTRPDPKRNDTLEKQAPTPSEKNTQANLRLRSTLDATNGTSSEQSRQRKYFGEVCNDILRHEGIAGFYQGLGPSLLLVSNPAVQFATYHNLVAFAERLGKAENRSVGPLPVLPAWQYFVISGFAKTLATVLSYPCQVVKTRLMVRSESRQSTLSCLRELWKEEPFFGLYRGMGTKLLQTVLNAAFMFTIYEYIVAASVWFL